MHLANCPHPDIAYAVGRFSRYTSNSNCYHWAAIERVFKYLKEQLIMAVIIVVFPCVIEGFCDANWILDSEETKATSGYVFILGGGAVVWRFAKQTVICKSTMEIEFIALDLASAEAEWLKILLADIPMLPKPIPAVSIAKVKSKNYNEKRRHIRHNSTKELLSN